MATNYLKTAYDELKSIIQTQYVRFKDTDRILLVARSGDEAVVDGEKFKTNLGYEDFIIFTPSDPSEQKVLSLTSGAIVYYNLILLYYKVIKENALDNLTATAENITALLIDNVCNSTGGWINLNFDLSYEVEKPEDYEGRLYGFRIDINFEVGKFP